MLSITLETRHYFLSCFHNYQTHIKCIIFLSFSPHKVDIIILTFKVQFSSVTQSCLTLCDHMDCSMPGFPVHHRPPEFAQTPKTHLYWVYDAIQSSHLCCPLLLLPSTFPSVRWTKYWSFSLSFSPSNEYSGLIFFRMSWLDLLAVQGTFKSLIQHHSSKASVFCSQLSL